MNDAEFLADIENTKPAEIEEFDRFSEQEQIITEGLQTFVEVGTALSVIRDERLYRHRYNSFEAYLSERWQMTRRRGYQMIEAADTVSKILHTRPDLPAPANDAQARELARVPEEERAEVWERVVTETDGKPTAAAVREAARPTAPGPAPATLRDPFSLPESVPSEEVHTVPPTAVLDRAEFLERRAAREAEDHARHVSDSLRRIVTYCAEGLASPAIREQYVGIYVPPAPDIRERVPVNAENIEAAAAALLALADLWRAKRETPEEQH